MHNATTRPRNATQRTWCVVKVAAAPKGSPNSRCSARARADTGRAGALGVLALAAAAAAAPPAPPCALPPPPVLAPPSSSLDCVDTWIGWMGDGRRRRSVDRSIPSNRSIDQHPSVLLIPSCSWTCLHAPGDDDGEHHRGRRRKSRSASPSAICCSCSSCLLRPCLCLVCVVVSSWSGVWRFRALNACLLIDCLVAFEGEFRLTVKKWGRGDNSRRGPHLR